MFENKFSGIDPRFVRNIDISIMGYLAFSTFFHVLELLEHIFEHI